MIVCNDVSFLHYYPPFLFLSIVNPPSPSLSQVKEGLEREVGTVKCCMEGRFKYVRTRETNLGNLVADIMRKHMKADVALLNSGTLRSDCLHEAGLYKMKVRGDREWKVLIGVPA